LVAYQYFYFFASPERQHAYALRSVLDVARRLPSVLFGVPLVLPALRIAFLIRGAAVMLGMPRTLAGFLPDVAPGTALLGLLRRP